MGLKEKVGQLFGKFDPQGASDKAAISAIVESYTYSVQLQAIPDKEEDFINNTADLAKGMIAFLDVKKEVHNFVRLVAFKENYEIYKTTEYNKDKMTKSPYYSPKERDILTRESETSIMIMKQMLVTDAQIVLAFTYEKLRPIIPVLNKPMPIFVSPGRMDVKKAEMPGVNE